MAAGAGGARSSSAHDNHGATSTHGLAVPSLEPALEVAVLSAPTFVTLI